MSKRFLHISDGWNNWWRYTRRTTLKKNVIIKLTWWLTIYIGWFTEVDIKCHYQRLVSGVNISATNIGWFFFIEINLSVTNTDRFTEAVFIKLQLPTLIVLDDYTQCLPYLCSPVYRIECFSRFISCHYKFNL